MKKFFLAFMILIALSSGAFAAENDDTYVRKDLFEAYMKNIDSKLDTILREQSLMREEQKNLRDEQKSMREDIKNIDTRLTKLETQVEGISVALSNRIDGVSVALSNRIEGVFVALSNRIEGVEKRFDDLRGDINIGIALIGLVAIFLGLPVIQRLWEKRKEAKQQYLKPEEIEKLIISKIEAAMKGNLSNAAL